MNNASKPDSSEATAILQEAMECHQQGNLYDADLLYAQVIKLQPNNAQALRLRAILARERGDIETSLNLLDRAVIAAPTTSQPLAERALTYMACGKLAAAEKDLRAARMLAPESTAVLTNLAALLQHRGHVREAIALYRSILERDDNEIEIRCNLAKALSDAGDNQAAEKESERAIEQTDRHPHTLAAAGAVLLDQHRYEDARALLSEATSKEPGDDMALVNFALASCELGELDVAMKALRQAVEVNPYNSRAVADLINCLSGAEQDAEALELGEQFLRQHPGERLVVGSYAQALQNASRPDAAAEFLDCEKLVQVFELPLPDGFSSVQELNSALASILLNDESLLHSPVSKSTTGGDQTGELNLEDSPELRAFVASANACVKQAADFYSAQGLANHPVMLPASPEWQLRAWGTVIRSGGKQSAHMHPLGWLSAVYYVSLPEDINSGGTEAGSLEFGALPTRYHCRQQPTVKRYAAKTGRLIIFPSWFWHQTVPFSSTDPRISIAFDVMPEMRLSML